MESLISILAGLVVGAVGGYTLFRYVLKKTYNRILDEANRESEVIKEKKLLEVKEKFLNKKAELEKEVGQRNQRIQQAENKLKQREISLNQRHDELARRKSELDSTQSRLQNREQALNQRQGELEKLELQERAKLEELSGLSAEEAKARLVESLKDEARTDAQSYINEIMDDAKMTANKEAKRIVIQSIQRVATETAIENSVTVFHIDNDEVKGRIIGREGRNIRSLETLTGVDIIIDDTPEAVVISCFDPVRKEIARVALERLIIDGRIHPARIEEIVQKVTREIQQKIYEEGERALFDLGIHNMGQEAIRAIGRLYFRTSYGQNVLTHSKEVAELASILAAEVGANRELAKRAALLHDIGKGAENDSDQNHAEVGAEMARKMGEDPRIVNAIAAHHNDCEAQTIEAVIVQIADAISAARPGARRETVDNYVKRLENLEETAKKFAGVEQAYAIQAGRELRILVNNEKIPDEQVKDLAKNIAKQIETDLRYPGRIKITMIRETRIVEYAR